MKLGIIISTKDAETAWNAFRLANFSLKEGDNVSVFLIGKGVECQSASTELFNVKAQTESFIDDGGRILACGTCMEIRQHSATKMCPFSTLKDLHTIIKESDKVITF
jgi:uncharacterized protein involved in oxidation of intracellular sulfur